MTANELIAALKKYKDQTFTPAKSFEDNLRPRPLQWWIDNGYDFNCAVLARYKNVVVISFTANDATIETTLPTRFVVQHSECASSVKCADTYTLSRQLKNYDESELDKITVTTVTP